MVSRSDSSCPEGGRREVEARILRSWRMKLYCAFSVNHHHHHHQRLPPHSDSRQRPQCDRQQLESRFLVLWRCFSPYSRHCSGEAPTRTEQRTNDSSADILLPHLSRSRSSPTHIHHPQPVCAGSMEHDAWSGFMDNLSSLRELRSVCQRNLTSGSGSEDIACTAAFEADDGHCRHPSHFAARFNRPADAVLPLAMAMGFWFIMSGTALAVSRPRLVAICFSCTGLPPQQQHAPQLFFGSGNHNAFHDALWRPCNSVANNVLDAAFPSSSSGFDTHRLLNTFRSVAAR